MMFPCPVSIQAAVDIASRQIHHVGASANLDAGVLLAHVLGVERSYIIAHSRKTLSPEHAFHYQQLIERRIQGEPVAYLTGVREFWSLPFTVTPDTLIPRPETELLIELCLNTTAPAETINACDLGTGSGAIALALAHERPRWRIVATDVSPAALKVARLNRKKFCVENVDFVQSSWFDNLASQPFHFILANPPYVAAHDPHLQTGSLPYEPVQALIASEGCDGYSALRAIAFESRAWLADSGYLFMEHGYDQQPALISLLSNLGYSEIKGHCDLNGIPRVVSARWMK